MATSGSTDFSLNRDQIIASALRKLRAIDPRIAVEGILITNAATALNLMLKAWQTDGVFLWLNEEIVLHLQYNQQFYSLGPTGDHCCLLSDAAKTQLSADSANGETSHSVDSITGIADADYLGIELDSGVIQWTTVDGSPSGTTVVSDDALTGAASTDNWVFAYTNKIARPLQIVEARVRDTDDVDTVLGIEAVRSKFMSITDKTSTGRTLDIHYNPDRANGQLYTWPVADTGDITDRIVMSVQRTIEDFDSQANEADAPQEALSAIIWNLAVELAPELGVDLATGKGQIVAAKAQQYYMWLKKSMTGPEEFYFTP